MNEQILIIEDDPEILRVVTLEFKKHLLAVRTAPDFHKGLLEIQEHPPALILLDPMLDPMIDGLEGWEMCRRIKTDPKTKKIPLLILSALGEEHDRVRGLDFGADDYLTKPFSVKELLARIRALLRRARIVKEIRPATHLQVGHLVIDTDRHEVRMTGKLLHLTPTAFDLLKHLAQHPGKAFTRDELISALWNEDRFVEEHNVDVHVHSLRKQIESNPNRPRVIRTVRGVGYKLEVED